MVNTRATFSARSTRYCSPHIPLYIWCARDSGITGYQWRTDSEPFSRLGIAGEGNSLESYHGGSSVTNSSGASQ